MTLLVAFNDPMLGLDVVGVNIGVDDGQCLELDRHIQQQRAVHAREPKIVRPGHH